MYPSKPSLIVLVLVNLLACFFLALQYTMVGTQSKRKVEFEDKHDVTVDWKAINLKKVPLPNSNIQDLTRVEIKDSNVALQVFLNNQFLMWFATSILQLNDQSDF